MKNKKIYGVVVLYNPNITEVMDNINSYINYLDRLYMIDNSEKNNFEHLKKHIKDNKKLEYMWLTENKGIAVALNIGKNKAIKSNAEYLLTMDQDSKFEKNFNKMIRWIEKNNRKLKNIAIVSPRHRIRKDNFKLKNKIEEKEAIMTSGNILNLELIKEIGDFNEDFFIDEVDHEFCYRIREKKYKILYLNEILLDHKLGDLKNYFLFIVTNHNYIRRYYITRNKLYMAKMFPKIRIKYLFGIAIDLFKILCFEKDKKRKIKYFFKGIKDFLNNKKGKLIEGV